MKVVNRIWPDEEDGQEEITKKRNIRLGVIAVIFIVVVIGVAQMKLEVAEERMEAERRRMAGEIQELKDEKAKLLELLVKERAPRVEHLERIKDIAERAQKLQEIDL